MSLGMELNLGPQKRDFESDNQETHYGTSLFSLDRLIRIRDSNWNIQMFLLEKVCIEGLFLGTKRLFPNSLTGRVSKKVPYSLFDFYFDR
jgi:hypothetical protein